MQQKFIQAVFEGSDGIGTEIAQMQLSRHRMADLS